MIFNYLLRHRPAAYFLNAASGMLGKIASTIGKNSRRTLMRINLTIILLFIILAQVTATGFAQNLTISKDNASIKSIFKDIKKQTGLAIIYQTQHISSFTPISLHVSNMSLNEVLTMLLAKRGLSYIIKDQTIVIREEVKKTPEAAYKPQTSIETILNGIVTDEKGNTLPSATIKLKGSTLTVLTDQEGKFRLKSPTDEGTLVISYIGYNVQEVAFDKNSTVLKVSLKPLNNVMNDVVVVGYGTVKKSDLTGAVSSVSADKITQVKGISNVAQALQGNAAGVQVNQSSGQPGEAMIIKIRGTNSINGGNAPLYVVDGLPTDGISAQLNPDDIERVEVLKDASATAIYGSRGANGVIMITTKKGKSGKTQVSYNGYYGFQNLRKKLDIINAHDYAILQNEVVNNDNASGVNNPAKPLPWKTSQIDSLTGKGTDWQDLVYQNARVQNHDLSFSGGNENTRYYTSFGYYDQDGIIKNSNFNRLSFRVNLDQKLTKKLSLNTTFSLQNSTYTQAVYGGADGGGGIPWTTMVLPPTQGVYDEKGNYTKFTGVSYGETNPVGISNELYNPSTNLRILGRTNAIYDIIDGLKLTASAGIDAGFDKSDYYAPSNISIGQPGGRASKSYGNSRTFTTENYLNYVKSFDKHNLDVTAGISYQTTKSQNLSSGTGTGFISDIFLNNNLGAAVTPARPGTGFNDSKLISYLGRLNYNYGGKYYLTLTGRYDGSSKFAENKKFAFFPSAAAFWRISEEQFMKSIPAISNLKIKASYGHSGNQAIANYQTLARISNTTVVFNNQDYTAYFQGGLPYNNLKWETTKQLDLGLELGLFAERLQFTFDYYNKKTVDLLLNVDLPTSSGFGSVLQNIGEVQNRGLEFQLTTLNTNGVVKWSSTLTVQRNVNKVLSLGSTPQGQQVTYKEIGAGGNWFPTIVGLPTGQLYGYVVDGIYNTNAEAIANGEPNKRAGDYKFSDLDGNKIIDGNDRKILTHMQPKFTFGFNNNLSYKNWNLSLLFVGSYGNDIVNEFSKYRNSLNGQWAPSQTAFDNRWTGPNAGATIDKPSVNSAASLRDFANSTWVSPGSYIKLRDITLGYNISAPLLEKFKISSINIFISAQNYVTFTKYDGYDPEVAWSATTVNGWDRGNYPSMKSLTAGIKCNF
ncbi:TonB-dependent receptor [Pedobacter kyungheensis]|uniref:TonB-dependent receptor n=1 Tax=Pedobacter kyungheensis TaxID=1069985 RepID=UPI000AC4FECC|nr:TonB-dependent receptor [Pedobacter kyungheensis]